MILAGDIGGTNTRLALYPRDLTQATPLQRASYKNDDFADVHQIVERFLAGKDRPVLACFGVAGLVDNGSCHLTNRDWTVSEQALYRQLGVPVVLANDVAAMAIGVAHLQPAGFIDLQRGSRAWGRGNVAVVAAGTGLGKGAAVWDGRRHHPLASEGGHADFAATSPIELELANWLRGRHGGHASIERVISGPALPEIAEFLVASGRCKKLPQLQGVAEAEQPAELTRLALAGKSPQAAAVFDIFLAVLARELGNAALEYLALGGVALAGGIPPRLVPLLQQPHFLANVVEKGRFTELLKSLPIRIVTDTDAALLGAAHIAAGA
ncbi:MAG: glk [Alphaproteobacteria bacterium]|nr:glk [Alphaproteobacteria bacterium]